MEEWTKDGTKVDRLLYAGNNQEKARDVFASVIKHRPRTRLLGYKLLAHSERISTFSVPIERSCASSRVTRIHFVHPACPRVSPREL